MATPTLYNSAEVAVMLRRDRQTVLRYARSGKLRSLRPGGREYQFTDEHIAEFLAKSETPAPKPAEPKPARNPKYTR